MTKIFFHKDITSSYDSKDYLRAATILGDKNSIMHACELIERESLTTLDPSSKF